MASQDHLIKIKSGKTVIFTFKNKKQNPDKLKIKKFNKRTRKHEVFTESKK